MAIEEPVYHHDEDEDLCGTAEELRNIKGDRYTGWKKGLYAPKPPRVRIYDPTKHCGHETSTDGLPCTNWKGQATKHPGQGWCKWHHGNSGSKEFTVHGLYSKIQSDSMLDALERVRESGVRSLDLEPEVNILRALVIDFVERHDAFNEAMVAFKQSFSQAYTLACNATEPVGAMQAVRAIQQTVNMRPTEVLDVSAVSVIIDRIGRMSERIHKMKQTSTITWEAVQSLLDKMGLVLVRHVTDAATIDNIRKEWHDIEIKID